MIQSTSEVLVSLNKSLINKLAAYRVVFCIGEIMNTISFKYMNVKYPSEGYMHLHTKAILITDTR